VTLGSTHGVEEKYKYLVFESATFIWSARKIMKLSRRKYKTMNAGSTKLCEREVYAIILGSAKCSVSDVHLSRKVLEKW
jgi:hypothetical protein